MHLNCIFRVPIKNRQILSPDPHRTLSLSNTIGNLDATQLSPAAPVLLSIAFHLQKKEKTLTSPELNQAVSNLESALNFLDEPKANLSQTTIANIRVYIHALKAEQSNRPFIKSLPQNPYIWGIYIFVLLGNFALNPLRLLKIYETLKPK